MSNVTASVIEEMKSELTEQLNDRDEKIDTGIEQAKAVFQIAWTVVSRAVTYYFQVMVLSVVLGMVVLDAEMLDTLRQASNVDILSMVNTFSSISIVIASVGLFFSFLRRRFQLRLIRQEKEEAISNKLQFVDEVGTVVEEILHRHGVINLGESK